MKNAMQKDFWREIKHTRSRFFSIMILVALSVAFLSGLKATAPDMKRTGDDYLDSLHLADIQVLSTLGLTDEDIAALRAQDKVEDAEGEYVIDAFASSDSLDAVGNTTAAIAKGFAIASAGLSAISLFVSYQATMHHSIPDFALTLTDPLIVAGIFIGAMMPFMFAALTMGAVSRAAHAMVEEVRRQFREIKGIMEYKAEPEYDKCVAISTSSALREMMLPGCLAIVVPVAIGCFNPAMLGGFLAGAVATGMLMAIFMSNAGGAWDNAKKYIEQGHHGGKGSEAHKAAVVGDTVGDPFKDTSGPSMNILINLMTIVSLTFTPLFIAVQALF